MKNKSLIVITTALLLSACGPIASKMTSEAKMLDKAESATGIRASDLTLITDSVSSSLDAVHYRVQDNQGNEYKCYFTSVVAVNSDTVCTKLAPAGNNQSETTSDDNPSCNALYKKAGKC